MFGRVTALTIAACSFAGPIIAQVPVQPTTAFDGRYIGIGTITHENTSVGYCRTITSVDMTITRGQVSTHITYYNTPGNATYLGTVNAAGEVSISREVAGHWITVSGIIHDKIFTGASSAYASSRNTCFYSFEMAPGPPSTTAFDGTYAGVSRTSEAMEGQINGCVPNGPPPPLTIVNGLARTLWGRPAEAEGSVGKGGVLVMQAPNGYSFDGQIGGKGTITGRFTRARACSYEMVYQKKGN